jgi:hypothetical protein
LHGGVATELEVVDELEVEVVVEELVVVGCR